MCLKTHRLFASLGFVLFCFVFLPSEAMMGEKKEKKKTWAVLQEHILVIKLWTDAIHGMSYFII